jgi:isochorismate pyruvate lyase
VSLDDVRRDIDHLDDQIVTLLAQRQQRVIRAAEYKSSPAEVRAPQRRVQMMRRLRAQASRLGVDPQIVAQVYTAMIDAFIELEHRALTRVAALTD